MAKIQKNSKVIAVRIPLSDYYKIVATSAKHEVSPNAWMLNTLQVCLSIENKHGVKHIEKAMSELKAETGLIVPTGKIGWDDFNKILPPIKYAIHWNPIGRKGWEEERKQRILPSYEKYISGEWTIEQSFENINQFNTTLKSYKKVD